MTDEETKSPLEPEVSPLNEADPNSINIMIGERINILMNTRPADITDAALAELIQYYRSQRARFILESQVAKAPRASPKTSGPKKAPPVSIQAAIDDMKNLADLI
jgi:hypothetical protein